MQKLKIGVGIIHDPNGLQAEWTWQLLNTMRWLRKKFSADLEIDLDVIYYPKARGTKEDSFSDILMEAKNSDIAYCWILQDHLVPSPFLFYHFYQEQNSPAIHGVHFNRHNVLQGPNDITYSKTITQKLGKVPENLICLRGFFAQHNYDVEKIKNSIVDFNGMYLADVLVKGGVFYPSSKTVNKYLNPNEAKLLFNFEGFRYLIDTVNINAITVPQEVMDNSQVLNMIRAGATIQ